MRLLRMSLVRLFGPIWVALTVYDVWRRLPTTQRRWLLARGRRQGLRIAVRAWAFLAATIGR